MPAGIPRSIKAPVTVAGVLIVGNAAKSPILAFLAVPTKTGTLFLQDVLDAGPSPVWRFSTFSEKALTGRVLRLPGGRFNLTPIPDIVEESCRSESIR